MGKALTAGETERLQRPSENASVFVLIEPRAFSREGFVAALQKWIGKKRIIAVEDVTTITENGALHGCEVSAAILSVGALSESYEEVAKNASHVKKTWPDVPILLVVDRLTRADATLAFGLGLSGCIPTTVSARIMVEVLKLIIAGGHYAPPDVLLENNGSSEKRGESTASPAPSSADNVTFSPRQKEVLELLAKGKSNKVIAHTLSMQESTVKVHVRQIMRKLNAVNRTEAALAGQKLC